MKRYLLPLLALAMAGAVLTGCDNKGQNNNTGSTPATTPYPGSSTAQ